MMVLISYDVSTVSAAGKTRAEPWKQRTFQKKQRICIFFIP